MAEPGDLITHTEALKQQGRRRLLVISGEEEWCQQQAARWMAALPGDWLWLGDAPQSPLSCAATAARTLLGREFLHAVFDARHGFNAEALAALSGTLKPGSWLLVLAPAWERWLAQPDTDSLRWSEQPSAIPTPNFLHRFRQRVLTDSDAALLRQHSPLRLPPLPDGPAWQPDNTAQRQLLARLLACEPGIHALISPRGRGKSALAGQLAAEWPGECLITAPAKVSTEVLARFAGEKFRFIAPDRLLAEQADYQAQKIDWLIIDEAAAIPTPLLEKLVTLFPRVLLTTTLQGFEGTGRGFLLKFCAGLPNATLLSLDEPLRWAKNDPLERFVDGTLLFEEAQPERSEADVRYVFPEQADWQTHPAQLCALYQLLASAHYRTSPLDLRRMMDAPGMHFSAALQGDQVSGAAWLVEEGGLSASLAEAVWAGFRRPRGNLVAQSLAAHASFPEAAQLHSRRISRIAIAPALRRCGIGRNMVRHGITRARGLDFLSVSFGYTDALWAFWRACGFQLVRIGTRQEASSGCYAAMAVLPISEQGSQLCARASQRLARDWPWLRRFVQIDGLTFPAHDEALDDDDWRELAGFAWAQRPLEAGIGALGRLVSVFPQPLPLLSGSVAEGADGASLARQFGMSGRKVLLAGCRQETQRALETLDGARSEQWRLRIATLREKSNAAE
ncbi:GNAT family N-acetyltransferase [Erwinia sp. 9145]|uniref:tRNA(Met) cytidine acetyltransferase TmcA n=1 Tax=Erwinia sp. 9145 TaxID=1500895 RepID=UPI000AF0728C|nr:GNAT family N-acetyltransferase [Erwinia sp. 9145]